MLKKHKVLLDSNKSTVDISSFGRLFFFTYKGLAIKAEFMDVSRLYLHSLLDKRGQDMWVLHKNNGGMSYSMW